MSGRRRPGNGDSDDEEDQRMAMLRAAAVDGAEILGQICLLSFAAGDRICGENNLDL